MNITIDLVEDCISEMEIITKDNIPRITLRIWFYDIEGTEKRHKHLDLTFIYAHELTDFIKLINKLIN